MWRGTNGKTYSDNVYFNCKYDPTTKDKTVYVVSFNEYDKTVSYMVGGTKLVDLVTGETIYGNNGVYQIPLQTLGTRVFQVIESNSRNAANGFKSNTALIITLSSLGVVIVALIVLVIVKTRKSKEYQTLPVEVSLTDQKE